MSNNLPFYLDFCIKNAGKMAIGKTVNGNSELKGRIVAYRNFKGVEQIGLEIPDGNKKVFKNMTSLLGAKYFEEDGWFNVVFDRQIAKACLAKSIQLIEDGTLSVGEQFEAAPIQEELLEKPTLKAHCGHKYCDYFCHLRYAGLI